jgi:predicted negative regulator of RcsB-dependent stress response
MASHLDLEEQEQLDQIKSFWTRWGNLITGLVTLVLVCFAAWNGWNYWQQRQATLAAVLFDTFEEATKQGDLALLARSLSDLQDQFPRTTLTAQAALIAAKTYFDKEKLSEAEKPLEWVVDHASDKAYVALARLRLSALAIERKDMAKARSLVDGKSAPAGFQPLFDDRLGDIALIEGKNEEAKTHFTSAYKGMDESTEYRRLIEVKLGTLGVDIASPEFKK